MNDLKQKLLDVASLYRNRNIIFNSNILIYSTRATNTLLLNNIIVSKGSF